jgi:hypothetical protein
MKIWVILYTYEGYDGEIDRLWSDEDDVYLAFSSKDKAQTYLDEHLKWGHSQFSIKEVDVQ